MTGKSAGEKSLRSKEKCNQDKNFKKVNGTSNAE
jgi:hypothetical protein